MNVRALFHSAIDKSCDLGDMCVSTTVRGTKSVVYRTGVLLENTGRRLTTVGKVVEVLPAIATEQVVVSSEIPMSPEEQTVVAEQLTAVAE